MGLVTTVIGIFMILYPFATATATTIFFGWSLLIAAVANVVFAFSAPGAGPFLVKVLLAILYGVAGLALVLNPALGVLALTLALGTMLIVQAGIELAVAIAYRVELPWGWMLIESLTSLALGLMIVFHWPVSSAWVIGTMVGAGVSLAGISRIVVAATVHRGVTKFERLATSS
jgi:uncharacterized membrane protein HdeD (DUF308 family)